MNRIDKFSQNMIVEVTNMANRWKPGEIVPESTTYVAYDKNGNNGGFLKLEKGERFPATQHSGSYYEKQ